MIMKSNKLRIGIVAPHSVEELGFKTDKDYQNHIGFADLTARELMRKGHSVTLYYLSHQKGIKEHKHKFGHKLVRCEVSLDFGMGKQYSSLLMKKIKEDYKKIDVFHLLSYYALQYDALAIQLHKDKKPFIVQYHSGMINWINPIHLAKVLLLMITLKLSKKILAVKPQEVSQLKKIFNINADFIPNGVDFSIFKSINMRKKKNSIIFVGTFHPLKNVPYLIRAFSLIQKKIPDASLTIVGDGVERKNIEEEIKNQKVKNVKMTGFVFDQKKLAKMYNEHEILVLPSVKEAFPLTVLEALACKTPSVITENNGAAEILGKQNLAVVSTAFNHEKYADDVVKLLKNRKRLNEMAENGSKTVIKKYTWAKVAEQLEKEYIKAIK